MWHYFPRGPLENRVLKTRFIIQKNFKNLQVPSTTSPHRIRSDQIIERVRSERGRPDKRERNSQIREGEKEIAHLGRTTQAARTQVRGLGRMTQVRDLGSRDLGVRSGSRNPGARLLLLRFFFFLLLALISFLAGAVLVYMSFKSSL